MENSIEQELDMVIGWIAADCVLAENPQVGINALLEATLTCQRQFPAERPVSTEVIANCIRTRLGLR